MPRKAVVKSRCALCGAKEVSEPRGRRSLPRLLDKKISVEESRARIPLTRYIRSHSAENYLIFTPLSSAPAVS